MTASELGTLSDINPHRGESQEETYRKRFRTEMYGSWLVETEQERKLRELAETYHNGCNAYDKRVCSGISPRTGEAMPLTPDEMRLINRHARTMRDEMIAEGWKLGFISRQVEEAIRTWVK